MQMCKNQISRTKEALQHLSLPFSFQPSAELQRHIRDNAGKQKSREVVMCQNCGSVMIIGGERLARFRDIGVAYCDRHCAGQDRSRVYRNNPEVFDKYCQTTGKNRIYPHTKVAAKKCSQCAKPFVSTNTAAVVCSAECRAKDRAMRLDGNRAKNTLRAFIEYRSRQSPVETKCKRCGVAFTALTRTSQPHHYCSPLCRRAIERRKRKSKDGREHRKRERVKLPIWAVRGDVSLAGLHSRSNGKCVQCKRKTVMSKTYRPDQATVDHIVPMSKGGLHIQDNLQLMCQACNSAKSNKIIGDAQMVMF
jgi:5-methylcytosine-specific restriction endonuclease McrA